MRLRISLRQARPARLGCQRYQYSSVASPYHSKVYAIPFALDPSSAHTTLLKARALITRSILSTIKQIGEAVFGNDVIKSDLVFERMAPVYVPTWRVDAELDVKCVRNGKADVATIVVGNACMSGHSHPTLARLCLNTSNLDDNNPQAFRPSMLTTKWSDEVIAMPFSTSPLALPDLARSIPPSDSAVLEDGTRFEPTSIRFDMLTATPILFPIYLAEYTHLGGRADGGDEPITLAIAAHESKPTLPLEGLFVQAHDQIIPLPMVTQVAPSGWLGSLPMFGRVSAMFHEPREQQQQQQRSILPPSTPAAVEINDESISAYISSWSDKGDWDLVPDVADWEDSRIVAWDSASAAARSRYLELGIGLRSLRTGLAHMKISIANSTDENQRLRLDLNLGEVPMAFIEEVLAEEAKGNVSKPKDTTSLYDFLEVRIKILERERKKIATELRLSGERPS